MRRRSGFVFSIVGLTSVILIGLVARVGSQSATLSTIADTYLREGQSSKNFGTKPELELLPSGNTHVLVAFDQAGIVAAVGSGALQSAHLELFIESLSSNWDSAGQPIDVHRVTEAWTETGATWDCPDDLNTKNPHPNCPTQWGGGSYVASPTDTYLQTDDLTGWVSLDVTSDVAAFLAGTSNYGWLVRKTVSTQAGGLDYTSREGTPGFEPRLVIVAEDPTQDGVPPLLELQEPSSPEIVSNPNPTILVAYSDSGSGINSASLSVKVDGQEIAPSCTVNTADASCTSPSLVEGSHVVQVAISDVAGNTATAEHAFWLSLGGTTIVDEISALGDSYLRGEAPNRNQGGETSIRLRQSGPNRGVVRFDPTEIGTAVGAGSLISATLELFIESNASDWGPGGGTVDLQQILTDWTELGVTWSCPEDLDLGNEDPDCASPWGGGLYAATPTSSLLHVNGRQGWIRFDVTGDVAATLGGSHDYGWILKKADEGAEGTVEYTSREGASGYQPRLVLLIDPPGASDTTPPTIDITEPTGDYVVNETTISLTVEYADSESGIDLGTLLVEVDGQDITSSCTAGASSATCVSGTVGAGDHDLDAEIMDVAGNQGSTSRTVTVLQGVDCTPGTVENCYEGPPGTEDVGVCTGGTHACQPDGFFGACGGQVLPSHETPGNGTDDDCDGNVDEDDGPPDPSTVAPPIDETVATDLLDATAFLYSGPNPLQVDLVPGTIEGARVAVVRGRVLSSDGNPLPGVTVSVLNRPDYGSTETRADGYFDLVINGGSDVVLSYETGSHLTAQRQVRVPWRDYAWAPDVVLIQRDPVVTTIDLTSSAPMQIAEGSIQTDLDGTRQATVLFPAGNQATMTMSDGSTAPITTLSVRATEFTVGPMGPAAMPGQLPSTSGYTYAVELSVDEAEAAGATRIDFAQAIPLYVENFLDFPTGTAVPLGYYDREIGKWIPAKNGLVIAIVGISGDLAELDIDGNGTADAPSALAAIGITTEEREALASRYSVGETLWRAPIEHFTPWDCNWPYGPPPTAEPPPLEDFPDPDAPLDNPDCSKGSIIQCQRQVLGETLPVTGTPYSLHYQSDRVPGRRTSHVLEIVLSDEAVSPDLKRIELLVMVAGQRFAETFPPQPNQSTTFEWDGLDAYGRLLLGQHPATVKVGYVYDAVYQEPAAFEEAFARLSGVPLIGNRTRQEVTLFATQRAPMGAFRGTTAHLGGWSLDIHHAYDPDGRAIYEGTGARRQAIGVTRAMTTTAGTGASAYNGDGIVATSANLSNPWDLAFGPDGSLYIADQSHHRIRKVDPTGTITTVAGNGTKGLAGDGGQAIDAQLAAPIGVDVAPDGTIYIAEHSSHRIRKVSPDGIISTVGGASTCMDHGCGGFSGDGGPADNAMLNFPYGIAIGPSGALYIPDHLNYRIRRIGTDGIITTIAGTGSGGFTGDGGPAINARMTFPMGIAVDAEENVYFPDRDNWRVRRVSPNGIITTVAGGCRGTQGDGGPALDACLFFRDDAFQVSISPVSVGPDGSIYIGEHLSHRVRRVAPDGFIMTVAGTGVSGYDGEGRVSTASRLSQPRGTLLAPDGALYVAETGNNRIRRVAPPFPDYSDDGYVIPSRDGSLVYEFSSGGKHLSTRNSLTGAAVLNFAYDGDGLLEQVTDADGNVTTIERDASGAPIAIVAPFGQRTQFTLDANAYLASVENPANETVTFAYDSLGRMSEMWDAAGHPPFRFYYDALGRLMRDEDPEGGFQQLDRQSLGTDVRDYEVVRSTAEGRSASYTVEVDSVGARIAETTFLDSSKRRTVVSSNGLQTITRPDQSVEGAAITPDPRFRLEAPFEGSRVVTQPSTLGSSTVTTRSVSLADPDDPLSVLSLTETKIVDGRTFSSGYSAGTQRFTLTTPESRQVLSTIDTQGRLVESEVIGLEATRLTYDANGRLKTIAQGTGADERVFTLAYNPTSGFLDSLTDPEGRQTTYEYDLAGRVTSQTLPGPRIVGFTYDPNGNLTSVTPPGRTAHVFDHTGVNLTSEYNPPDIGLPTDITTYSYNLDRQLDLITRPDGQTIDLVYGATTGRLDSMVAPSGTTTYGYSPTTGQLASIAAPGGENLAFTYDGSLFLSETWSGTVAGSVSRSYDTSFRLSSFSVNGADTLSVTYDDDDLLTGVGSETIDRDPQHGLITGTTLGVVTDSWGYNAFGELESYTASASGAPVFSTSYTRDKLGRIVTKTETIDLATDTYTYHYDPAGRLEGVDKNTIEISRYTYDDNGNRESYVGPLGSVSDVETSYDGQDRLTAYGDATYTYTDNGEIATKTDPSGTASYTYDVLGNLTRVDLPDGTVIEYVIDGRSRRVGKKVDGTLVQGFLYEGQLNPIGELDGSGNVVSRFVYGTKGNVPDYMVKGGATYRIVSDHLGSPRLVVESATGAIAQELDYDEFGNVLQDTNPGFQPFGFAGGVYDAQTRLTRFGARDYDGTLGRWNARDPILFAGGDTNLYAYVVNDPQNFLDPDGTIRFPLQRLPPGAPGRTRPAPGQYRRPVEPHPRHEPGRLGDKHQPPNPKDFLPNEGDAPFDYPHDFMEGNLETLPEPCPIPLECFPNPNSSNECTL